MNPFYPLLQYSPLPKVYTLGNRLLMWLVALQTSLSERLEHELHSSATRLAQLPHRLTCCEVISFFTLPLSLSLLFILWSRRSSTAPTVMSPGMFFLPSQTRHTEPLTWMWGHSHLPRPSEPTNLGTFGFPVPQTLHCRQCKHKKNRDDTHIQRPRSIKGDNYSAALPLRGCIWLNFLKIFFSIFSCKWYDLF